LTALLAYETPVQTQILNETGSVARRLMDIDKLGGSSTQFFSYEEDIRDRILQVTQDEAVAGLLAREYTGTALALILSEKHCSSQSGDRGHFFRSRGTARPCPD